MGGRGGTLLYGGNYTVHALEILTLSIYSKGIKRAGADWSRLVNI